MIADDLRHGTSVSVCPSMAMIWPEIRLAAGRGEKQHHVGNVVDVHPGPQRDALDVLRAHLVFALAAGGGLHRHHPVHPRAFDRAGADRVDAHAGGAKLHRERLGQADDRPFRRGIGRAQRVAELAGGRRGQHDQPAALRPHHPRRPAAGQEGAVQVGRDAGLPVVVVEGFDPPGRAAGAGIGADHVDPAPLGLDPAEKGVHLGLVGDVGLHRDGAGDAPRQRAPRRPGRCRRSRPCRRARRRLRPGRVRCRRRRR